MVSPRPRPGSRRHRQAYADGNGSPSYRESKRESAYPPHRSSTLPAYHGQKVTKGVRAEGESGRRGISPWKFLKICFRSSCTFSKWVNVLWPFVPVAMAMHFAKKEEHLWKFILAYIAMVPAANLLGFAGQELARKLPHVFGVLLETTFGSVVELILFMVLLKDSKFEVIQDAILGSILANLLLCMGLCFFAGGLKREEQEFHEAISEVGSNLMLVAGMALILPATLTATLPADLEQEVQNEDIPLKISRAVAVLLLCAYFIYLFFQIRSHHGLYDDILQADDHRDDDRSRDLYKEKLTLTESVLAIVIAITFVSFMAVFLVEEIEFIVEERHVTEAFLGLILIPLVEKAAEHITAIDEAWDNQMNFALSHILGASVQTALLNTPLVVIVGWGMSRRMDLEFVLFPVVMVILAILVVGGFLRDKKSNYLEGSLCVLVYIMIAVSAYYFPHVAKESGGEAAGAEGGHKLKF